MSELKSSSALGYWTLAWWLGFGFWVWASEMAPDHIGPAGMMVVCFFAAIFVTLRWTWRRHTIRKARIQAAAMVEAMEAQRAVAR